MLRVASFLDDNAVMLAGKLFGLQVQIVQASMTHPVGGPCGPNDVSWVVDYLTELLEMNFQTLIVAEMQRRTVRRTGLPPMQRRTVRRTARRTVTRPLPRRFRRGRPSRTTQAT